jgi:hypothetical protein
MSYSWGAARSVAAVDRPRTVAVQDLDSGAYHSQAHDPDVERESDPAQMRRLAAQLAPMVGVWERLIAQHRPNRSGRCRKCTKGGTGLPTTPWPCTVYGIAELARRRHDRDRR